MPRIYTQQVSAEGGIPARRASGSDVGGTGISELGAGIQSAGQDLAFMNRKFEAAAEQQEISDVHEFLQRARGQGLERAVAIENSVDPGLNPSTRDLGKEFLFGESGEGDEGSLKAHFDEHRQLLKYPAAIQAFDRGAAELTTHFSEHFLDVHRRLAREYAKTSHVSMIDRAQNDVERHPDSYDLVMRQITTAMTAPDGPYSQDKIPRATRDKLMAEAREAVTEYKVRGEIKRDPYAAMAMLEKGVFDADIPAERKTALYETAKVAIHAKQVEGAQAAAEANRQRIELARTAEATLVEKLLAHDQNPSKNPMVKPQDILDSHLAQHDPQKALTLTNLLHARAKENAERPQHTNPVVMNRLFKRIHLPDGDPKKLLDTDEIYNAYTNGHLSFTDMGNLRREVTEARSPEGSIFGKEKAEFFHRVGPQILKPGPFGVYADPSTPEQFYRFQQDAEEAIKQYRKLGKDPRELLDPTHKNYLGKQDFIKKYQHDSFGSLSSSIQLPESTVPATPSTQPAAPAKPRKSLDEIFGFKK